MISYHSIQCFTLVSVVLALVTSLAGCNARGVDEIMLSAPASCEQLCGTVSDACGIDHDYCLSQCRGRGAVAEHTGCEAAHGSLTGCEAEHADLCNPGLAMSLCEDEFEFYRSCYRDSCRADPASQICRTFCRERCRSAELCGDALTCDDLCDLPSEVDARCRTEAWDLASCHIMDAPTAACTESSCATEQAALDECHQLHTPPPPPAVMYESCGSSDCASGACWQLQTRTTDGSMCTTSCQYQEDCGPAAACVPFDTGAALCLPPCFSDDDCGEGTVCATQYQLVGYVSHTTYCVPDA